ncbi:MAG: PhoH family protein [Dictyoglomus sp.]|nr:PhoH family protein [Dictyoglomus sp.]MCX7941678.1 PhoH family protein [Dictyoglomaceae bacterium]MDW8188170.1 PhoH family protein [Dictyoglomus sp.]
MEQPLTRAEIILPKGFLIIERGKRLLEEVKAWQGEYELEIFWDEDKVVIQGIAELVNKVVDYITEYISDHTKTDNKARSKVLVLEKKLIRVSSPGQKRYIEELEKKDIVFVIGPAGTGKSYLAIVAGLIFLKEGKVKKIILTRPVVEAGEKLGFLPGDLQQKINPYLKPLYDFLEEFLGYERVERLMEKKLLEVVPLAYMRGRTFKDSFILLDEAQNTTPLQMKMFLTRFGSGSKMVITGDVTQIDLEKNQKSGLLHAWKILKDINDIGFVELTEEDIVRHDLVKKIVKAYDKWEKEKGELRDL